MDQERKGKVKAGKKRELANVKNSLKKLGKASVPSTLKLAASLPEHGKGKPSKRKELIQDVSSLYSLIPLPTVPFITFQAFLAYWQHRSSSVSIMLYLQSGWHRISICLRD